MQWWAKHVYPNLTIKPLEAVQQPGDILYVPPYWNHATINMDDTVSVAMNLGRQVYAHTGIW